VVAEDKHRAGLAHFNAGRLGLAETSLRAAAAAQPRSADVRHDLGVVLRARGRLTQAARAFGEAIALAPDMAPAHLALAAVRQRLDGDGAAEPVVRRLVGLAPTAAPARVALGDILRGLGRLDEARGAYETALALDPCLADARFGLGFLALLRGDPQSGWPDYEHRAARRGAPPAALARQWRGENPDGKVMLLYAEQGLGDTLQFLRYAAPLAERGASILAAVPIPLMPLAASVPGVRSVVRPTLALPPFDVCVPLPSLPLFLGAGLDDIPSPSGYVAAPTERVDAWRARLGSFAGRTVAIAWAGNPDHPNDHNRSIDPALLAPLLRVPGVRWLNLQKGPQGADLRPRRGGPEVVALGEALADFADTAAVLELADLVITVDTALCHLAGALGRPTWLMLPFAPDWRWRLGRRDSPWYASMRLYRQPEPRNWSAVVAEIAGDLEREPRDTGGSCP
jgi:hypothetical protein